MINNNGLLDICVYLKYILCDKWLSKGLKFPLDHHLVFFCKYLVIYEKNINIMRKIMMYFNKVARD